MSLSTRQPRPSGGGNGSREAGLLFVCTGNICRSPFAETVVREALRRGGVTSMKVTSAGTEAVVGEEMDPLTSLMCEEHGVDGSAHVAQQLRREHARDADLILTATRAQRRHVVQLEPRAVRYTFTIRQAGRLLESMRAAEGSDATAIVDQDGGAGSDLRRLRVALARHRGAMDPVGRPEDDDVLDPHGRGVDAHRHAVMQMMPSLDALTATLAVPADRS